MSPGVYIKTIGLWFLVLASSASADESYRFLKVKDEVFTNVSVTTVTATDIYFKHAGGIASAKLKDLNPELQEHFHFDPDKSARIEEADIQATADFQARVAQQKPANPPKAATETPDNNPDYVLRRLNARSVRGQPAPQFQVEKWLTHQPATDGKFVLIDFWATWCPASRNSISELNSLQKEFGDRLAVIGISDEREGAVRHMTSPVIQYAVAIDRQARMKRDLRVTAIPHCILIDPSGIVRFEGDSQYLNDTIVKHYLDKYSR